MLFKQKKWLYTLTVQACCYVQQSQLSWLSVYGSELVAFTSCSTTAECVAALPTGPLKPILSWNRYLLLRHVPSTYQPHWLSFGHCINEAGQKYVNLTKFYRFKLLLMTVYIISLYNFHIWKPFELKIK